MRVLISVCLLWLWFFLTKKKRDQSYVDRIKRIESGEPTIKERVRELIAYKDNVKSIVMSFKTYQRWHMEENIEDGVTIKFGRKLEIDGIPIEIDNTVGDYIKV